MPNRQDYKGESSLLAKICTEESATSKVKCSVKVLWIENIRAISIIAVIMIHTVYSALLLFGDDTLSVTGISLYRSLMNLMWWGVPCFLMITGYLLLKPAKEISYEKIFKKYIPRMLVVLLLFGTVFAWVELFFVDRTISISQIGVALLNVFKGESWAHLWYIYCLIGIYLLLPIYRILAKNMSDNDLKYYLLVSFVFLSLARLTLIFEVKSGFYIHVLTIYPFWLFMGLAIERNMLQGSKRLNAALLCLSSIVLIGLTLIQFGAGITTLNTIFGYDSPFVVIQALAIFNLIKNADIPRCIEKLLCKIGNNSFGIYVIHMFFVNVFYKALHINPFKSGGALLLFLVLVNLIFSYLCTAVLKKLPVLRRIL